MDCGKVILDEENGVLRQVREQEPQHYILKVESFSVLQNAASTKTEEYFESTEFDVEGYTWVLCVYPRGNVLEQGNHHLSLSVRLVNKLSNESFIDASLRFFIQDQIRGTYLTIQDLRDKRFHALKHQWGIPKVVPLYTFCDASNGYLVNDACILGVEILVKKGQIKRSVLSHVDLKKGKNNRYTWIVKNFSDLNDLCESPVFQFEDNFSWNLELYPRGNDDAKGKYVSIYLQQIDFHNQTQGNYRLFTRIEFYIKNQCGKKDQKQTMTAWFTSDDQCWGFPNFVSISDVYDISKGFLVGDTLIVEANMEVMLALKDGAEA